MALNDRSGALQTPLTVQGRWDPVDARLQSAGQSYTQGALALTFPLVSGLEAEPASAALSVLAARPAPRHSVPDPDQWASRFLQAVVEVVSSDRPLTQLARWTNPQVFAEVARRRQRIAVHRSPTTVRAGRQHIATVHVARPGPGIAEVAARVAAGGRSRALAARLDFERERWLCTAIDFG